MDWMMDSGCEWISVFLNYSSCWVCLCLKCEDEESPVGFTAAFEFAYSYLWQCIVHGHWPGGYLMAICRQGWRCWRIRWRVSYVEWRRATREESDDDDDGDGRNSIYSRTLLNILQRIKKTIHRLCMWWTIAKLDVEDESGQVEMKLNTSHNGLMNLYNSAGHCVSSLSQHIH